MSHGISLYAVELVDDPKADRFQQESVGGEINTTSLALLGWSRNNRRWIVVVIATQPRPHGLLGIHNGGQAWSQPIGSVLSFFWGGGGGWGGGGRVNICRNPSP